MTPQQQHGAVLRIIENDVARHERHIVALQQDTVDIRILVSSLAAKVAVYAALGATVGGAVVGAIVTLILK